MMAVHKMSDKRQKQIQLVSNLETANQKIIESLNLHSEFVYTNWEIFKTGKCTRSSRISQIKA